MARNKSLTKNQLNVYRKIEDFIRENGYSPTLNELCGILIKANTTVWDTLSRMKEKGYVDIERYTKRGIRLAGVVYDESIFFCENDIKKEKNDKQRPSKRN